MFNLGEACINIGVNRRSPKSVYDITGLLQDKGLSLVSHFLFWFTMPIISIAVNDSINMRKVKVNGGNITQTDLATVRPSAFFQGFFYYLFNVGIDRFLMFSLPYILACIRTSKTHIFHGCRPQSKLSAASATFYYRHVVLPIMGAWSLSVGVSTRAGTETDLTAWFFNREFFVAIFTNAIQWLGVFPRSKFCFTYFLPRFCAWYSV